MRLRAFKVLTAFALAVFASRADAQSSAPPSSTPSVRMQYARDAGAERCADEQSLRSAVTTRLGYDPFRDDAVRIVTATIGRAPRGLRGRVEVREADGAVAGSREIVSARNDCGELVSAMALAISIAIDPMSLMRPAGPVPSASSSPAPPASEAPAPSIASASPGPSSEPPATSTEPVSPPTSLPIAPAPAETWHPGLRATVIGAIGTEPAIVPGFVVAFDLTHTNVALGVEARFDVAGSLPLVGHGNGAEVHAAIAAGGVHACVRHAWGRIAPRACVVVQAGATYGGGSQLLEAADVVAPYVAAGARVGVDVTLVGPLFAMLVADVYGSLARTSLEIVDQSPDGTAVGQHAVWTTGWITGTAGVGLGVRFR